MIMEELKQYKYIIDNFNQIRQRVQNKAEENYRNPGEILIVAVSKTFPPEAIKAANDLGIFIFGENYAQELREKLQFFADKPNRIEWHFIGHLQTNKVKYLMPYVQLIHSVDSAELAEEINKRAILHNKVQNILMQVNTSGEESKSGVEPEKAANLAKELLKLPNLNLIGLMTIGTFSDDERISRKEFSMLRNLKNELNKKLGIDNLCELSMGMSHDYEIAIEEGATIVRIGTAIFGNRNYNK